MVRCMAAAHARAEMGKERHVLGDNVAEKYMFLAFKIRDVLQFQ